MERPEPTQLVTILDYWRVLRQYRSMIAVMFLASVTVTGVVSKFFLPAMYEAKAVVLPAREEPLGGGMSFGGDKDKGGGSRTSGMVLDALGGKGVPSVMDTLLVLLKSRNIAEAIVADLNLTAYYGTDSIATTTAVLLEQVEFKTTPHKAIEIIVTTKDPEMAARIANTYAIHLDRLNKQFSMRASRRAREFIERRLAEKIKFLNSAEEATKDFQTANRSLALNEQAQGALQAIGDLHAQIVGLEVELAALREYTTPSHPMINQLQAQIKQLRRELDRMETDQADTIKMNKRGRAPISQRAFPSLDEAPTLALQSLRLARQVKVEEAVYGMLVGMLEQVKIAEVRDLPTIELLDPAVPPRLKSKPKTLQNVLTAGVLSLAIGVLLAYFLNYLSLVKAQEALALGYARQNAVRQFAEAGPSGNGDAVEKAYPVAPQEPERITR